MLSTITLKTDKRLSVNALMLCPTHYRSRKAPPLRREHFLKCAAFVSPRQQNGSVWALSRKNSAPEIRTPEIRFSQRRRSNSTLYDRSIKQTDVTKRSPAL